MTPLPEEKTVRGVKRLKREPRPLHHTFHDFTVTNRAMHRNICFHTRLQGTDQKTTGGTFRGSIDQETVERLAKAWFTVEVTPTGRPVFVDKQGRRVSAYVYIDPADTEIGRKALNDWRAEKNARQRELEKQEAAQQAELEELMDGMTHEEIIRKLKGA